MSCAVEGTMFVVLIVYVFVSFCSRACIHLFESGDEATEGTESQQVALAWRLMTSLPPKADHEATILGIPNEVAHARATSSRDDVWDFVHALASPYVSNQRAFRNICLLCVSDAMAKKRTTADTWKVGLRNIDNASNAKLHLQRKHKPNDAPIAYLKKETDRAEGKLKRSSAELAAFFMARTRARVKTAQRLSEPPKEKMRRYLPSSGRREKL